jgi:hypothetical protein
MAYDRRWKYIESHSSGEQYLFDLETDTEERRNVASSRPEELCRLQRATEDHYESVTSEAPRGEGRRIEASEAAKHRLRRLGYDE